MSLFNCSFNNGNHDFKRLYGMLKNTPLWLPLWQLMYNFPDPSLCHYPLWLTLSLPQCEPKFAFSSEGYLCDLTATPLILHTPEAVTGLPPSQELNTQ